MYMEKNATRLLLNIFNYVLRDWHLRMKVVNLIISLLHTSAPRKPNCFLPYVALIWHVTRWRLVLRNTRQSTPEAGGIKTKQTILPIRPALFSYVHYYGYNTRRLEFLNKFAITINLLGMMSTMLRPRDNSVATQAKEDVYNVQSSELDLTSWNMKQEKHLDMFSIDERRNQIFRPFMQHSKQLRMAIRYLEGSNRLPNLTAHLCCKQR